MADGLLNKASIILTPTGYKAGTLYNVAPVVEPYEDFDFARASVASRVNSSGLVEMVGRTFSSELVTNGDFATDSDWTFSNIGGSNGWRIADGRAICDTSAATKNRNLTSSLSLDGSKDYKLTIDILQSADNITIYVGATALSPKLPTGENLGYEYYISSSDHSGGALMFYAGSSDLQEIDNVSVKEIIDTNNIPRISYDSNGDNGHILLEPTSTNLITYSEDFSQWSKEATVTLTPNYGISPDGTQNSTRMQMNADDSLYVSASSGLTASFYVKGTLGETIRLSNGSATIHTLTGNWDRVETYDSGSVSSLISINTYSGATARDIEIWGAQAEALSFPTSYIPTLTGSTVTRATETATGAGSATLINSTEGVLYVEALMQDTGTFKTAARITATNTSTTDGMWIYFRSDNKIQSVLRVGGVDQTGIQSSVKTTNLYYKVAFKFKQNDFALWIDGIEVATDSSGNTFSADTLSKVGFVLGTNTNPFYGKCKALAVFNEALSDSELTQLTT